VIAILGDIHANVEALRAVIAHCESSGVEQYYSVGDVIGYYANPCETIDLLNEQKARAVLGNHELYVQKNVDFDHISPTAAAAIEWTRKTLRAEDRAYIEQLPWSIRVDGPVPFRVVHASLMYPFDWTYVIDLNRAVNALAVQDTPVCFYGHTHQPMAFSVGTRTTAGYFDKIKLREGSRYLINVGSVGQPRNGDTGAHVVIFDPKKREVRLELIPYDPAPTIKGLRSAGLPSELSDYLSGRG